MSTNCVPSLPEHRYKIITLDINVSGGWDEDYLRYRVHAWRECPAEHRWAWLDELLVHQYPEAVREAARTMLRDLFRLWPTAPEEEMIDVIVERVPAPATPFLIERIQMPRMRLDGDSGVNAPSVAKTGR